LRQKRIVGYFTNNNLHLIAPADKGLGPVALERKKYIRMGYQEHLSKKETYERLPNHVAEYKLKDHKSLLCKFTSKYYKWLPEHELVYLQRAAQIEKPRYPQMYFTIKMHKKEICTRPVCSQSGSYLSHLSKWLDFHLNKVARTCKSYLKNDMSHCICVRNTATWQISTLLLKP